MAMPTSRRQFMSAIAGAAGAASIARTRAAGAAGPQERGERFPVATGPFSPSWESLAQYQFPEWFRDAKFGIWAHWTAQCVPEQGDWYARRMYQEGDSAYRYHLEHYGHPSKVGFKEIDHLWNAENWDPERLIDLYRDAGAKYFVALANHHDNLDCYNSRHQPWNSVRVGPKKDIVGMWARAARDAGLRLGVTVHAARTWEWFEVTQGADKQGPLAGVAYDGRLTRADGRGQWWDGLDPQDLYAQNHKPGEKPDAAYIDKFYLRVRDLIDSYHPDLLYFDDGVMPLNDVSDAGLHIAAHYYNSSAHRHGGRVEAVMTTKGLNEQQRRCLVWDIERGKSDRIEPYPWQTDTCIGDWHYLRRLYEQHQYKTPETVIHMLADIVSKNGNLLLNIPVRGDGTIDPDEETFVREMARWIRVNGEAIYGTRPWEVFGEGPSASPAAGRRDANFNEGRAPRFSARDLRFTTKGDVLYAIALGWPEDRTLTIRELAKPGHGPEGRVTEVRLLGHEGALEWSRSAQGLVVKLPEKKPCEHAISVKITGRDFRPASRLAI